LRERNSARSFSFPGPALLWKRASGENAVFQPRQRIPAANRYLGKTAWRLRIIEAFAEERSIRAAGVDAGKRWPRAGCANHAALMNSDEEIGDNGFHI
jgi:hypothetical protein